jgi:hypothetical protein
VGELVWIICHARARTFFTDRISISVALALFLAGHFVLMYLSESKDRLVIRALERHDDELDQYFDDDDETENALTDDVNERFNQDLDRHERRR